jgi:hypothetical protein
MHLTLITIGNFVIWPTVLASFFGRISPPQASGIVALGNAPIIAAFALDGSESVASAFAGLAALNAWGWWHGGGSDGTRRRLRSWKRRFQGVRRTAPSHA